MTFSVALECSIHQESLAEQHHNMSTCQIRDKSCGHIREGVCTSYMSHLGLGETSCSHVAATIPSNPTFGLDKQKESPILMIAGGCGIAPIRAFLEEQIASSNFGQGHLYLGFRSPSDEVYTGH